MLDERQLHRPIALLDQAIEDARSLGTGNTTTAFDLDRREAHTLVGGNESERFPPAPAREPLQIHPVLLGVALQAQPHGAAGKKMLQSPTTPRGGGLMKARRGGALADERV